MLRFSRSEIAPSDRKATQIVDGTAAKAWLAGMGQPVTRENLAEITDVLHALGAQGAEEGVVLQPRRKFAIADRVRATVMPLFSAAGGEDRYKVLPLDDELARHFWSIVEAALALRDAYAWLVSQLPQGPSGMDEFESEALDGPTLSIPAVTAATALHRALDVSAITLVAVQRARWTVPAPLWDRHCVLGQLVRDLDCQDIETIDALRLSATKTCRAAFVFPVLVALGDPASRTSPEFEVMRMGAQRWSAKVGFRLERRIDGAPAPGRPITAPGPTVALGGLTVRFDTQNTLHSIDKRVTALAEGLTPREAGIGDLLRPPAARDLLVSLKLRWGPKSPAEIDSPDRAWRPASSVPIVVAVGMPTREGPTQSGQGLPAAARAQTYAYQRMREGAITQSPEEIERSRVEQLFENAETWSLVAESSDAIRCVRKHMRPRVGLQRLLALRLGSDAKATPFLLGWIEALQGSTAILDDEIIRPTSAHHVRVRLAPGVPQLLQASADDTPLDGAFLLVPGGDTDDKRGTQRAPFVPMISDSGLRSPIVIDDGDGWDNVRRSPRLYGLVLPHATFRPQRVIRAVRQGAFTMLRLEELMMRGSDFDLVRFTPL